MLEQSGDNDHLEDPDRAIDQFMTAVRLCSADVVNVVGIVGSEARELSITATSAFPSITGKPNDSHQFYIVVITCWPLRSFSETLLCVLFVFRRKTMISQLPSSRDAPFIMSIVGFFSPDLAWACDHECNDTATSKRCPRQTNGHVIVRKS